MNKRNHKHGFAGTSTYYCWQNLKRTSGGVCVRWHDFSEFIADMGPRPSSAYWLFRARPYQRSRSGNVSWRIYKRQFRGIWQYLTPGEVLSCYDHIWAICLRGRYDFDAGLNELHLQDLSRAKDSNAQIHSWIKRYLPRILAVLKKRRSESRYDDEVNHGKY
jgi:hypothetical protein